MDLLIPLQGAGAWHTITITIHATGVQLDWDLSSPVEFFFINLGKACTHEPWFTVTLSCSNMFGLLSLSEGKM